jgi:parallel beta-helix repeat protein
MKKIFFYISTFATQLIFATNYYVSPSGDDNNNGLTLATAFQTIEASTYAVAPGDTVFVRNGVYTKTYPESLIAYLTISGTVGNPITFRNYPGETPILQMNATNWAGFAINGCDYITIDGFTIIGNNDNITLAYAQSQQLNIGNPATSGNGIAINTEYNNETNKPHHIIVRNCKISKCGGGGIYTYNADYTTIENNTIWECGWYAPYGNSGISLYQNWNSDTNNSVFKNFITGNTCYRNENYIPFFVAGTITDGNGIIIDDGRNTQNNSTLGAYLGKTYVANNLVFDNGARGIHCFESDNVLVINNTCYQNCKSPSTREGELTAFSASNINFVNNIVSPSIDIPPITQYDATNITAFNNLFTANQSLSNPLGTNTIVGVANFINPTLSFATANFHLQQNSLAINAGLLNNAPITDKDGNIRLTNNLIDIGCYEFQNPLKNIEFNKNEITIFPNPTQKMLYIDLKNKALNNSEIIIFNSIGEKIKTLNTSENEIETIDISEFQSGIYFVSLLKNNTTTFLGKFIKN